MSDWKNRSIEVKPLLQSVEERTRDLSEDDERLRELRRKQFGAFNGRLEIGGLTVVAAPTGQAKTSLSANFAFEALCKFPDKIVVAALNEENSSAWIEKIACIELGRPLREAANIHVVQKKKELLKNIQPCSRFDATCLEDVLSIAEQASQLPNVSIVLVDYLQNIIQSRETERTTVEISKTLGSRLKDTVKKYSVPIVVFAQIRATDEHYSLRVVNDRSFAHHAHVFVEARTDFESRQTELTIHKSRFGQSGEKILLNYTESGRYETA